MTGILRGLTRHRAETDPRAGDWRLRGRTYAIPFDRVWTAALALCGGGLAHWSLLSADDQEGVIRALALTRVLRRRNEVRVTIGLDENGQTRVDLEAVAADRRPDLGSNARAIRRFLDGLDRELGATPAQVLDASREPRFVT